jgi:hypothetical protein
LAARLARAVALASPLLIIVMPLAFVVLPLRTRALDPSMRATVLSAGMSQVMNCVVLAVAAAIPASVIWVLARSRARVVRR